MQRDDEYYRGRPLLRLLDLCVLALIGHLSTAQERDASEQVTRLFGDTADWRTRILAAAGLPSDMGRRIVKLWDEQPPGVDPVQFMREVSRANFDSLIDRADRPN